MYLIICLLLTGCSCHIT